jgi:DNA ligase (NAD+)
MEGFGEISARNLVQAAESSKGAGLGRLLFALGIPHVGSHLGQVLARHLESIDAIMQADRAELETVPEVGPEVAGAIERFFEQPEVLELVERLRASGVVMEAEAPAETEDVAAVAGKTFVITGTLPNLKRSEAKKMLQDAGARVTSSVSGNTDYLVVGADAGSKLDKARKIGVELLDESEMLELLGEG